MSKVLEIVVIGGVGSGKSHVLRVIDNALRQAYGPHAQVVSRELLLERGLGSPGAEPAVDTIFNLMERQPDALEANSTVIEAVSAQMSSFPFNPLDSAIRETVGLLHDHAVFLAESGLNDVQKAEVRFLGEKLNSHLNHLLGIQLSALQPG